MKIDARHKWSSILVGISLLLVMILGMPGTILSGDHPAGAEEMLPAQEKIKAACIYFSPIADGGWNFRLDEGRKAIDELPYVDTIFVENVPAADSWRVINDLARKGNNLIFTTGYDYMQTTAELAEKYPDIAFENCSGYLKSKNMGNYFARIYDAGFLTGMVAGDMTKSNNIGFVAAHPIPMVLVSVNAFALGVKKVNPKAVVRVVWSNTWYDPGLEAEAAEALAAAGADVIAQYQNSAAVQKVAQKHGIYSVGFHADMSQFAPKSHLTAPIWNWAPIYLDIVRRLHDGKWRGESRYWGLKEGAVDIAPFGAMVPENVRKKVLAQKEAMVKGDETAFPYYGPVKDQKGKIRVQAGKLATDAELNSMDYLVDNVEGSLPKSDK